MTAHEYPVTSAHESLPSAAAPADAAFAGNEVPQSLDALLAQHGSDPAFDSRRYLRRPQWVRATTAAHAVVGGALTLGAIAATLQHAATIALAVAVATVGATAIALSHAANPGRLALRECLTAATATVLMTWITAMIPYAIPVQTGFAPAMVQTGWHLIAGGLAIGCALVVVAGLSRPVRAHAHVVRFCAALMGVATVAATAV
jgi:hypothetical protein